MELLSTRYFESENVSGEKADILLCIDMEYKKAMDMMEGILTANNPKADTKVYLKIKVCTEQAVK